MAQILKGETFTDVTPGKTVTSTRLNNHVDGSTLLKGAVADQPEHTGPVAETDFLLMADISDVVTATPKKVSPVNAQSELMRLGVKQYADDSGAANAYVITLAPAAAAYTKGMVARFVAGNANTGASTLAVNGLAAKALKKCGTTALEANDIVAGKLVVAVYDGTNFQVVNPGVIDALNLAPTLAATSLSNVAGLASNLVAFNNAGTPNTKVDLTADALVLADSSNNSYAARGVSLTLDIAGSGANGLDTGSPADSTWYYFWVIYNPATTTVAGLLSTSGSSPTMPSGYTYKALAGQTYRNSSSHFDTFYQTGRTVWPNDTNVFTAQAGSASYTTVSLAAIVPPNALTVSGNQGAIQVGAGTSHAMAVAGTANGLGAQAWMGWTNTAAFFSFGATGAFSGVPLKTSQTLYWKSDGTTSIYRLNISGYTF